MSGRKRGGLLNWEHRRSASRDMWAGKAEKKKSALQRSPQVQKWCSIQVTPAFCGGYVRVADIIRNAWGFPRTCFGVVVSSDRGSNSDRELDPVSNLEVPQNFICSPDAQSTRIIDTLPDCDGSVRHVCCSSLPYQHPASHEGGHFAEFFALTLR
jgi:hypothetical protein